MREKHICPECGHELHEGQHKFSDGLYFIKYCKNCGYKEEKPEDLEE